MQITVRLASIQDKGMSVDGVLYSKELAASGDIIERNRDLFGALRRLPNAYLRENTH